MKTKTKLNLITLFLMILFAGCEKEPLVELNESASKEVNFKKMTRSDLENYRF
jgi:PBP1b-binding outer membrane lipoprotein LpoB